MRAFELGQTIVSGPQAWTEEAQLHAAAARAPALAEQLALMRRAAALGPTHSFPVRLHCAPHRSTPERGEGC